VDDVDGDRMSNLAEYWAGSNPAHADGVFLLLLAASPSSGAELRFTFAPGRQYTVQGSADLIEWQSLTNTPVLLSSAWLEKSGTNLNYPSPVTAVWRDTNGTAPQRFYRVESR
jgi:hypothetical protein